MPHTIIVGGGVIGLACAHELGRGGERVTLIERGLPGGACSAGNLGWICPVHSDPLPAPGLAAASIRWMLRGDSPLYIRPSALPRLAGWLWRFWRHCNRRDYERALEALAELNRTTLARYDALARDGLRFEIHRSRLMLVALGEGRLEQALAESRIMERWGHPPPERLSAAQARALEPALSPAVAGALLYEEERHVRPETLCAALAAGLPALGVEVRTAEEVVAAERRGRRIAAVLSRPVASAAGPAGGTALRQAAASARLEADHFLIASGAWSGSLARRFGFRLPMQAGKGYSLTLASPARRVRRPLYFGEHQAGATPFEGALRLGGTMELSGLNQRLDRRRVVAIRRAAERYLPGVFPPEASEEWVGMRPITPDGLPAIGRAPGLDNVFVASGHGMLGITLAPATAAAIAGLIARGSGAEELRPFDPARFRAL
jgi:D-amino-acid dehydrogenase